MLFTNNDRKISEEEKKKFKKVEDLAATLELLQFIENIVGHDDRLKNKDINEEIKQIVDALISAEEKIYASYGIAKFDYLHDVNIEEESL